MNSLVRYLVRGRGFYVGALFHEAAQRSSSTPITLGRPLAIAPERGRHFTVGEMAELVDDFSARLWAAGIRPSDHVALHTSDSFDIAILACAIARVGAVPALLSPELDERTVVALLERLDDPWLVTDQSKYTESAAGFRAAATVRGILLAIGAAGEETMSLGDLAGAPRRDPVFLPPREPSLITHSSGTTGVPKLAVHCPEAGAYRLFPQKVLARFLGAEETAALCVTFVHSRFYQGLAMFLEQGNPLLISQDSSADEIAPLLVETRPGYVETHPNTYIEWEKLAHAEDQPLASVRYFGATFDAMHPRTMRTMLEASRRRRPRFVLAYGQSEIGPIAIRSYSLAKLRGSHTRRVGRPIPGFITLRVVDDDGRKVSRGTIGHLEVRSNTRILTYQGEDARFASQVHDDWWRLGDMGYVDRLGQLHLLDRAVDRIEMIRSNLILEDLLLTRVKELREVVIVPDTTGRAVPVVCTHDDAPLDQHQWRRAVMDLPEMGAVVQVPFASLPRTSTRKVQRSQLAAMFHTQNPANDEEPDVSSEEQRR